MEQERLIFLEQNKGKASSKDNIKLGWNNWVQLMPVGALSTYSRAKFGFRKLVMPHHRASGEGEKETKYILCDSKCM